MTDAVALALGAALAVACVVLAARPFLRGPARDRDGRAEAPGPDERRVRLEEERDRALAALKELEFDHRTGKISDADYRELVGRLRREAADAIRALDGASGGEPLERARPPARAGEPLEAPNSRD